MKGENALCTAVYGARESTGLPREMELEVEVEQMFERLACDGADRALTDVCEYRVQQLAKQGRAYTCCAVCRPHPNSILTQHRESRVKTYKQELPSRRQPTRLIVDQVGY